MTGIQRRHTRALLTGLLVLAPACGLISPRPDPTRFYVLAPLPAADAADAPAGMRVLGLGPITFPRYLERAELVTRVSSTEIRVATFDRWAEPLRTDFERTLAQNLTALTGVARVVPFPWFRGVPLDVVVEVDVVRFEPDLEGTAFLDARWRVRNPHSSTLVRSADASLREPANAKGTDAAVDAMSRALGALSREIAAALTAR
jgi:uncharacterized lipoprotein YmbA